MKLHNDLAERKSKYFTNIFLYSLIKTSLHETLKIGVNTEAYIRIYWGMEMLYVYDEINRMLEGLKKFSSQRIEHASQRALFYGCNELEKIKYILSNNLDKLELIDNTDIDGQFLLDF